MCFGSTNVFDIAESVISWFGLIICVVLVIKYKKSKKQCDKDE